ncbi:LysM domain-containing protein [Orenia metallireducens]|uniref:LysM domain-containing protein n=1 Tax=Orenia metallireducens TaxID=1413210 RepID=A0A285H5K9_9FIRM|nr:LysM peptidoglycan-binding domain-containing protein [Orenia metallireducens]PRX29472.1 LysM domain-containing protein [Orenia metallireducens]SNY30076.1 LysM domain-containing protein [Orenia metallireducens]
MGEYDKDKSKLQQVPPNTKAYQIRKGDTLYSLAQRFNTTVAAIISANPKIDSDNLQVGDKIFIPLQRDYPSCPEGNYYTIKAGDSFYTIADRFNIAVVDLQEANPYVEANNLKVGEVICIPLATPPVKCPQGSILYIVKKGDTLYSISKKYKISVAKLKDANPKINPEQLLIGQKICIPAN